jgi:hypothetical protein
VVLMRRLRRRGRRRRRRRRRRSRVRKDRAYDPSIPELYGVYASEEINPFQATYNYQQYKIWRDSCAHDHRTTTWKLSPAPFT